MKNIYRIIVVLLFLISCEPVHSQIVTKELKIGDTVPEFAPPKIINSKRFHDFAKIIRNGLVIIDFWATSCSGCVESLPYYASLEAKFKQNIVILPVTYEKEAYVTEFLKHNKYTRDLNLTSVVNDSVIHNLFKHKYIPHEVWIYDGVVVAITNPEYVNEAMINKVLKGEKIDWPLKYDFYKFESSRPIFKIDSLQVNVSSTPVQYSAISDAQKQYNSSLLPGRSGIFRDSTRRTIRTFFLNQSILAAYVINLLNVTRMDSLIKPTSGLEANNIIWEVANKSKYTDENTIYKQQWMIDNGICYESMVTDKGQSDKTIYQMVLQDLNRLLGLNVRWERRKEEILYLNKLSSKSNSEKLNYFDQKMTISSLLYTLNQEKSNPYVFGSASNQNELIKITSSALKNRNKLIEELKLNGYALTKGEREVDKLIFSEVNGGYLVDGKLQAEHNQKVDAQKNMAFPSAEENNQFLLQNKSRSNVYTTKSGLQYEIVQKGIGRKAGHKSTVLIDYESTLVNGRIVDSSYKLGKPQSVKVENMIAGIAEALQLMSEGSKWIIYLPSDLAYGTHTLRGKIPPSSTLIFHLHVREISKL